MRSADERRAAAILWSCAAAFFLVIRGIATWTFLDELDVGWWEFVQSGILIFGGVLVLAALLPRMGSQLAGATGAVLVIGVISTGIWTWSIGQMVGSFGLFVMTLSLAALAFDGARHPRRVRRQRDDR